MILQNRRDFLASGAAAAALLATGQAQASSVSALTAAPADVPLLGERGGPTRLWTYNGTAPGPELRVRRGARVRLDVLNRLPQGTSVHWHGIRIENAMDGVAGLTQDAIEPGADFPYDFTVPDAGTFWYHPHNRSWEQLARGLYGGLIVEEDVPYPVDDEMTLILDDWRLSEDGSLDEESFGSGRDWSHGGRLGNWATVNGVSAPTYSVRKGSRVRVRLINTSNARIIPLTFGRLPATIVALDGQPLAAPDPLKTNGQIVLAPAQRADIVVDMNEEATLAVPAGQDPIDVARFALQGTESSGLSRGPVPPLPSNGLSEPEFDGARLVTLRMDGGAMRWLESAKLDGETVDGRTLAQKGMFWAFNGQVGRTDTPLFTATRGETIVVDMINDTAWPHGIHLHGHHFREIRVDDAGNGMGPWRDTILLQRDERRRVALVADNPGDWMLHCHMLEHQAAGMATWFRVS